MSQNETAIEVLQPQTLAPSWNRAEIDSQVATAQQFPRDLELFRKDMTQLAEIISVRAAADCEYCVPVGKRDGVQTWAQSAGVRFAELLYQHWGNLVIKLGSETDENFAYGVAQVRDLQTNRAMEVRIPRSIRGKYGKFSIPQIKVTCLAAQKIAFREAVFAMVPKLLWLEVYEKIMDKSIPKDWEEQRYAVVNRFKTEYGVERDQVLGAIGVRSEDQITKENYRLMRALYNTLRNDGASVGDIFPRHGKTDVEPLAAGVEGLSQKAKERKKQAEAPPKSAVADEPGDDDEGHGECCECGGAIQDGGVTRGDGLVMCSACAALGDE